MTGIAHVGHQREVEQLRVVELVVEPSSVRSVVLLHHAGERTAIVRHDCPRVPCDGDPKNAHPTTWLNALIAAMIKPASGAMTRRSSTNRNSNPTSPGCHRRAR